MICSTLINPGLFRIALTRALCRNERKSLNCWMLSTVALIACFNVLFCCRQGGRALGCGLLRNWTGFICRKVLQYLQEVLQCRLHVISIALETLYLCDLFSWRLACKANLCLHILIPVRLAIKELGEYLGKDSNSHFNAYSLCSRRGGFGPC